MNLNQDSFSRLRAKRWNAKNSWDFLFSIMEAEDDYVEVSILLEKMANSASSMH